MDIKKKIHNEVKGLNQKISQYTASFTEKVLKWKESHWTSELLNLDSGKTPDSMQTL